MKTLALLPLLFLVQDRFPAEKHPWLRFKPGSTATYKMTITYGALTQEGAITYALKEAGEGYVVSVKAAQLGAETTSEESFGRPVRTGTETVRVGDKEHECSVWTSAGRRGPKTQTARWWISDRAPLPLRIRLSVEGEEDFDVSAVALDESLTIDGRRYACTRLEGETKNGGESTKVVLWTSPEVPGGAVRMAGTGMVKSQKVTSTLELSAAAPK